MANKLKGTSSVSFLFETCVMGLLFVRLEIILVVEHYVAVWTSDSEICTQPLHNFSIVGLSLSSKFSMYVSVLIPLCN